MKDRELSAYIYLAAAFVAALVAANVLAAKIITIFGVFVPAGVLAYSITFAVTDTICELWGRQRCQTLVNAGFAVLLLVWGLIFMAIQLPAAPFWGHQEAFTTVLGSTNRIILASLIAYGVSQSLDIWLFTRLKQLTASRYLWLRNNVSTLLSQSIDSTLFIMIAFYGELPVLPLILGQLTIKYLIAALDTPIVYALVYLLRGPARGRPYHSARKTKRRRYA